METRAETVENPGAETEPANETNDLREEVERLKALLFGERLKLALWESGAEPAKAARMARLIDSERVYNDGDVDREALESEIEALFAEFP
jgi:hypothetical protein